MDPGCLLADRRRRYRSVRLVHWVMCKFLMVLELKKRSALCIIITFLPLVSEKRVQFEGLAAAKLDMVHLVNGHWSLLSHLRKNFLIRFVLFLKCLNLMAPLHRQVFAPAH